MKPLLIGEDNPHSLDPAMALYPIPEHAAGGRLARILGLSRGQYLRAFDRVNLCERGRWDSRAAGVRAAAILCGPQRVLILLGRRVARAFGLKDAPPFAHIPLPGGGIFILPHPSGRCREWNTPLAEERARKLLRAHLPGDAR